MKKKFSLFNLRIPLILFAVIGLFFFTSTVNGASITWTGGSTGDWNTGSNWTNNVVPGTTDDVSIPLGKSVTISSTPTNKINSLSVLGSLTINNGTVLTVEQLAAKTVSIVEIAAGSITNNGTLTITQKMAAATNAGLGFVNSPTGTATSSTFSSSGGILNIDMSIETDVSGGKGDCVIFTQNTSATTPTLILGTNNTLKPRALNRLFEVNNSNVIIDGTAIFGSSSDYQNYRFIHIGSGTLTLPTTANLTYYSGYVGSANGTVNMSLGAVTSTFTNNGFLTLHGGVSGTGCGINLNPQTNGSSKAIITNNGTIAIDGTFTVASLSFLGNNAATFSTFNNNGTLNLTNDHATGVALYASSTTIATLNNTGTMSVSVTNASNSKCLTFGGTGSVGTPTSIFNNNSGGNVTVNRAITGFNTTIGCIVNNNSGAAFNFNVPTNNDNAVSSVNKIIFKNNGGIVTGRGIFSSGTFQTLTGTINPGIGTGIGAFTFSETPYALTGTYLMNINGKTTAGVDYDQLLGAGSLDVTGVTVQATIGGSYLPVSNDVIELIKASTSCTGNVVSLNPLGSYWAMDYTGTNANLKFSATPSYVITSTPNFNSVTGTGTFVLGASVSLTASKAGYTFVNWTENGNVISTSNPYTFTSTADRNIVAIFVSTTDVTWDGDAGDGKWDSPTNWSSDLVPIYADNVSISAGNTVIISTNVGKINRLWVLGKLIIAPSGTLNIEQITSSNPLMDVAGGEVENAGSLTIKQTIVNNDNYALTFTNGSDASDAKFTNTGNLLVDLTSRTSVTPACINFNQFTDGRTAQFKFGGTMTYNLLPQAKLFQIQAGNALLDGTYTFGSSLDYKNWRFIQAIAGNLTFATTANITVYSGNNAASSGTISSLNSKDVIFTNNGNLILHGGSAHVGFGIYLNPQYATYSCTFTNNGTITIDGNFPLGSLNFSGVLNSTDVFNNQTGATLYLSNSSGTSTAGALMASTVPTVKFNNAGSLDLSTSISRNMYFGGSSSTFNNTGIVTTTKAITGNDGSNACTINNNAGGIFNFNVSDNGQVSVSSNKKIIFNNNGGKVIGRGQFASGTFFPMNGTLSPGGDTGIGKFEFLQSSVILTGKCIMQINGKATGGTDFDQIVTTQPSSLIDLTNTSLEVALGAGYTPSDLDVIPLFTALTTRSGFFTNVTLPVNWATQYTGTNANLKYFTIAPTLNVTTNSNFSNLEAPAASDITVSNGAILIIDANSTIHDLTIEGDGKVTNVDKSLIVNNFTINSDVIKGTGTYVDLNPIGGLTIAQGGSSKVQQYLASGRNWYISSPVSAATGNVVLETPGSKLWQYNEVNSDWITDAASNSTPLSVMKGYVANTSGDGTVTFTGGTLNSGNKSITIYRTSNENASRGFNLVGNPYPSFVNARTAISTTSELEKSMWYRTKNQSNEYVFDTYNTTSGIGTNNNERGNVIGTIPPMQAVWVRVADTYPSATLALTNSLRSHKSDTINPFKSRAISSQKLLRLQVSNGTNIDETIVLFNENALDGYDAFDSHKMSNRNTNIPEIYTVIGNENLVINGLKSLTKNQMMPLSFSTGTINNFTIKASEVMNFNADTQIILKDNLLNSEQDITDGSAYNFTSDVTNTSTRFSLLFKTTSITTRVDNTTKGLQGMTIFKNANNQITINCNIITGQEGLISVCNAIGHLLVSIPTTGTSTVIHQSFSKGVYFVKVTVSGKQTTQKVIIN